MPLTQKLSKQDQLDANVTQFQELSGNFSPAKKPITYPTSSCAFEIPAKRIQPGVYLHPKVMKTPETQLYRLAESQWGSAVLMTKMGLLNLSVMYSEMTTVPHRYVECHNYKQALTYVISQEQRTVISKDDRIQFLSNNAKLKGLKHAFKAEMTTKKFIVKKILLIRCSFFSTLHLSIHLCIYLQGSTQQSSEDFQEQVREILIIRYLLSLHHWGQMTIG